MPAILWTTTSALLMMSAKPVTEKKIVWLSGFGLGAIFLKGVYQDEKLRYIEPYQAGEGEGCRI